MFRKSVLPPITHLFARLGLLLFIASFGLSACTPDHCGACGMPAGYNPDATPLVDANGILYYIAHTTLYALQDSSGKLLWQYTNPSLDHDPPVVSDGIIYIDMNRVDTSDSNQNGVWIYALSGSTGQVLWHTRIASFFSQIPPPEPRVIHGIVYAQGAGETYGSPLFALRASDGKVLWSESPRDHQAESVELLFATPQIAYLASYASNAGYVLARRTRDGALLWHYSFPLCHIRAEPPLNNTIYLSTICGTGGEMDTFQAESGKLLWHFSWNGLITVTTTRDVVYLDNTPNGSARDDHFFALDAYTGLLLWKHDNSPDRYYLDTHIWAANDDAVFTTINGVWESLGARDGKPLWTYSSKNRFGLEPSEMILSGIQSWLLSGPLVYILDHQQLDAFQTGTGELRWNFSLPDGGFISSATLAQGIIYVSERLQNQTQTIYAIRADTGTVLWHMIQQRTPQLMTQNGVYFGVATGQPYHYTYSVIALQSDSGKQMWTFQA